MKTGLPPTIDSLTELASPPGTQWPEAKPFPVCKKLQCQSQPAHQELYLPSLLEASVIDLQRLICPCLLGWICYNAEKMLELPTLFHYDRIKNKIPTPNQAFLECVNPLQELNCTQ